MLIYIWCIAIPNPPPDKQLFFCDSYFLQEFGQSDSYFFKAQNVYLLLHVLAGGVRQRVLAISRTA